MGSGASAKNNGNRETGNSDENSSAPQWQKREMNAESPDGGHGAGKGYLGFTNDRHSHAPVNRGRNLKKIPQGGFIASGHTVERVDPATRIRNIGCADSSGDQGSTSLNGLAHRDTKMGMLGRDLVISKLAMNITPSWVRVYEVFPPEILLHGEAKWRRGDALSPQLNLSM